MAPGFELMGWLKQAGADAVPQAEPATSSAPVAVTATGASQGGQSAIPAHNAPVAGRLVPPHSQAAAALAAALSAGGVPEKKHPQPHGVPISPLQEVLDVDRSRPESTSTLVVSKIANVKSEISRRHGHAIAVDGNYICYGLKGGQIRILNKHTGARTLLKDHAAPVIDLCFFRHDSERCLLASVDTAGQVHVRKVYEEDAGGEDTVRDELLARHTLPLPSGASQHTARLAWHPTYDFVLAVVAGPAIYLINVPPTADVAGAPEYAVPVAAATSTDGAYMTSVAFSPMGELLAAGDAAGYVYVWALSPEQLDPALIQPLAPESDIRFQAYGSTPGDVPYGEGGASSALAAVVSLQWMPRGGVADAAICRPVGSIGGVSQTLLTGDAVNANLKLWSIDLSSKPLCTHALRLVASGGGGTAGGGSVTAGGTASGAASGSGGGGASSVFFNHMQAQPLYDCVVLANELRNHVYVLHVDFTACPDAPTFDYFAEFSVKMPILSYTLIPEAVMDEVTEADAFYMYTIQADAVQQYTLVPAQCFPLQPQTAAPLSMGGGAAGPTAGLLAATTSLPPHYHHHHLHPTASVGNTASTADGASVTPHAPRDPLAVLLALQQQHHQRQLEPYEHASCPSPPPARVSPAACLSATSAALQPASAPLSPLAQPAAVACNLVSAPSDVSDATSRPPGLPLTSAFAVAAASAGADAPAIGGEVQLALHGTAVPQQGVTVTAADGEEEGLEGRGTGMLVAAEETGETTPEGEAEAVLVDAAEGALEEGSVAAETATEAVVGVSLPAAPVIAASAATGTRSAMLLTPSQLMQSAAAAAAAASRLAPGYGTSANGSSGGGGAVSGGGGTTEDAYSTVATAGRDPGTGSVAATSRTQSLAGMSNMTPCLSEANLEYMAAAAAAAEGEELAELEGAAAAAEAAAVSGRPETAPGQLPMAITEAVVTLGGGQHSPGPMPPLPSEQLVRRISQGLGCHLPLGGSLRPQSAPSPPQNYLLVQQPASTSSESTPAPSRATPAASPRSATNAAGAGAVALAGTATTSGAVAAAPSVDVVSQQQLDNLMALQRQLLDQMSAGQRELLKVIRSEAQRSTKAVADAAASRAAEAVARKAAEERRRESAELQRAITAAINGVSKDISQRVADAAANTSAAIKAAIGPAVRAAVSEALPAALTTGPTAAVLEQALGSQLATALPRAVADGLGAAFTAKVVPPLERATATMFGQMEIALRAGLDSHLAPLGPLAGLGGSLRDATTQVTAAAKLLKSEATAAQSAALRATTSPAAVAAATSTAAVTAPSPSPTTVGGKGAAKAAAGGGAPKAETSEAASSRGGQGVQSSGSSQRSQHVATSASLPPAPQQQPVPAGPPPTAVANASSSAIAKTSASATPAVPPAVAVPPAAAVVVASSARDVETKEFIMGLIQAGDADGALSRVLERQDLALVLWTCHAAGGAAVLAAEPCPLSQVTLLSLLTFLCFDLSADVDLKLGWIDGILKRVDVRDPGMAPHIRGVLESVKGALVSVARGGAGATALKAKHAVHQVIGLITMLS